MSETGPSLIQTSPITLWSRYKDGGEQVIIVPGQRTAKGRRKRQGWTFTLADPGGVRPPKTFQSARSLLVGITKHPEARHLTLDRYFGIGKYEPPVAPQGGRDQINLTILEILDPSNALELRPQNLPLPLGMVIDPGALASALPMPLGIDLAARGDEVAKLLFAGFGHAIHANGYDPDDVLQEVYAGILVRNRGTCAFDPRKASFGHYVHMVAQCVMSNWHRKQNRRKGREQTGAPGYGIDGESGLVDVQDSSVADKASITIAAADGHPLDRHMFADLHRFIERSPKHDSVDAHLALQALPLVQDGYGRTEIAEHLGVSKAAVSRALTFLRRTVKEWLSL